MKVWTYIFERRFVLIFWSFWYSGGNYLLQPIKVQWLEVVHVFLKRFAYPCRYSDLVPRFGRPVPEVRMMSNYVIKVLPENFRHLLHNFTPPQLSQQTIELYAHAVHDKGAELKNCRTFVDGTVRPICRPNERIQRILYNGHKRLHAFKFQSVAAPNGLIANLYSLMERRRYDSGMLAESNYRIPNRPLSSPTL